MDDFFDEEDLTDNPTLGSITVLVGSENAQKLSKDFGGRRLKIPKSPGIHSPLAVCLGLDAAIKISQVYAGANFDVPISPGKKAKIVEMTKAGFSASRIAKDIGCTERYVFFVRSGHDLDDPNQLSFL